MAEEIYEVTWGFWGAELKPWQAIQRLVLAGFHDPRLLLNMFAIIEGESGSYTKAWHANVTRTQDEERKIVYDNQGRMEINSIDLGFIQRNVKLTPSVKIEPTVEAMKVFVDGMFDMYPQLALADESAAIAYEIYQQRGFAPWYAYKPGTPGWQIKKRIGSKAIADYLLRTQVGKIDGKLPVLEFKD